MSARSMPARFAVAAGRRATPAMRNLPLWHRRGAIGVLAIATGCLAASLTTGEADGLIPLYYVLSLGGVIALWAYISRSSIRGMLLVWPLVVMAGMDGAGLLAPVATSLCIGAFAVAFLFAGLTQPRGISLLLLPPAVASYLLVFGDLPAGQLAVKLAIAAAVWIAVSEAPAWLAADLREAHGEMERHAATDPLTGLANRRSWDERLPEILATGASPVLLLVDLDHFKLFNDKHGHVAGDQMLIAFARVISEALPEEALAARWGGEEFSVALPDLITARQVADQIRAHVPSAQTCSIGLAEYRAGETVTELTERADAALYAAKSAGRDRIVAA